jgi:hypothetical protein
MFEPYPVTKNDYDTFRKDAERIIRAFDTGQYYKGHLTLHKVTRSIGGQGQMEG